MKTAKFLPILALVFALVFYGCKKNNPAPASQSELIIGKWSIQSDTSRQYINGVVQSTYVVRGINSPYYRFNADGTGTMKYNIGTPDLNRTFTYTVPNDTLVFNVPKQPADIYGEVMTYKIVKLSSNALILLWEDDAPSPWESSYKEYIYATK